ncbi:hypothetical protein A7X93_17050 [Stenotrophomonas maltophilia]|nr:hypothetical protein A7X93_17050 [Stenotrophomonas maltophilia]
MISDRADEIDDLLDLDASLIRLIIRSQTRLRELLQQYIDQQLSVTLEQMFDAFFRQLKAVPRCDFGQQRIQMG